MTIMMMSGKVLRVDRSDGDHRGRHDRSSVIVNQSKRFPPPSVSLSRVNRTRSPLRTQSVG